MKINITNFRNNTLKLFGSKTVKNRKANTLNVTMNRNVSNQISSFLEGPSSRHFLKKKKVENEKRNEAHFLFVLLCVCRPKKEEQQPVFIFSGVPLADRGKQVAGRCIFFCVSEALSRNVDGLQGLPASAGQQQQLLGAFSPAATCHSSAVSVFILSLFMGQLFLKKPAVIFSTFSKIIQRKI